jgi:phage gp29-like protein
VVDPALLRSQVARITNSPGTAYGYVSGFTSRRVYNLDELLQSLSGFSPESINQYFSLLTEPAVFIPWSKQVSEIVSTPHVVLPGDDTDQAKEVAKFVENVINNLGFSRYDSQEGVAILESDSDFIGVQKWLLSAIVTGLAPIEIVYTKNSQGQIVPDRLIPVEPDRIIFDEAESGIIHPRLRTISKQSDGIRIPARKFILHRYWAMPTISPYGQGIGRQLYWPVQWKRDALSLWMQIANKHADPTVIGVAPQTASDDVLREFHKALKEFSADGVIALRDGYTVETRGSTGAGVEWLSQLCDYSDKQAAMLLLGEATSGERQGGSEARETINETVRLQKAKEFSDCILQTLNRTLVSWVCELNYPNVAKPKIVREFWSPEVILDQAVKLDQIGIKIDRDWLETVLGMKFREVTPKQ